MLTLRPASHAGHRWTDPTADVVLFGARLAVLVEKLQTQSLTTVLPLDARYAHALGQNPWVARIVVSRIDKQGGAAP